jgi:class 3 adenylate cyclase
VFSLLQKHLQVADQATTKFGGEIDKMIEDKIMIVYEHDLADAAVSHQAILAAEYMLERFMAEVGHRLGIGINQGITVAGIMGAENARLSRTVVGDPVNLAARLAAIASAGSEGGTVISGNCTDGLPCSLVAEKLPISHVKGKTQSVEAYLLVKVKTS